MSYTLRSHQERAIELLRKSFSAGNRCPILQASTGFGKTIISVEIIKKLVANGKRVLFVVDSIQLIDQTSETFDRFGLDHGVIQADHWRANDLPLQLASVQTLTRRRNKPMVEFCLVDECHVVYSSFAKLITQTWNGVRFIGLSATPFTKGLGKIYDDLIVVETTQGLIDKGYLCDFIAYGSTALDVTGIPTTAGDYNQAELGKRVNNTKIVGDVVKTWLKRGQNRQTVCFAVNVAHSKAIVDEFKAYGVSAEHIDANTKSEERDDILSRYEAGEIKILSNVGITTKGWDSPKTSCCILARPTKSLMLYIQMVGRVLRTAEGKTEAIILDHGRNIERLGFPTDELPQYLCDGDKDQIEKRKSEDREKPLPKPCPECNFMKEAFICPSCGYEPKIKPTVVAEDLELKKLARDNFKQRDFYAQLLGYARSKGFKDGWAYHKYFDKFGEYPRKVSPVPKPPGDEVKGFIQHLNIKNAKSKAKKAKPVNLPLSEPVAGYTYTKQVRKDGEMMIRCERDGRFQGWAKQTPAMMEYVNGGR